MKTREEWLNRIAVMMEKTLFKPLGHEMPPYRITCGWPAVGATRTKNPRIGECHYADASADGAHELIVSMAVDDPIRVAGVLAHEMVHAAVGHDAGHKKPFKDLATKIGLTGKMTATEEGPEFVEALKPLLEEAGDYPHGALSATTRKKQGTRLVKLACLECGYTVRTTQKWIQMGLPMCPCNGEEMDIA